MEAYSVKALAESIIKTLLLDDEDLNSFGESGRRHVLKTFSPYRTANQYSELYRRKVGDL